MIKYCEIKGNIYISVSGHLTAPDCPVLREIIFARIEGQNNEPPKPITKVLMDMTGCTYMDSTFIGLVAGINKKLKKIHNLKLELQNIGKACMELLVSMGLTNLLNINDTPVDMPDNMRNIDSSKNITAEEILDAHENLMEISEENKQKFSNLRDVLTSQIKK